MNAARLNLTLSICTLVFAWGGVCQLSAQGPVRNTVHDVQQTRMDYRLEKPYQYQPSDPWHRSKTFRRHTGHWGLFYNCDGEECKRESPYICWKINHEPDLPARKGFFRCLCDDLDEVKRRIRNGACCPDDVVSVAPACSSGQCGGCSLCTGTDPGQMSPQEYAIAQSNAANVTTNQAGGNRLAPMDRLAQGAEGHQIDPATGQCKCQTCQKRLARERKLLR